MINVYIYLNNQRNAKELVMDLMERRLLAHASIDKDNDSFARRGDEIIQEENYVITGQTKALLFNELVEAVDALGKGTVKIYSVPITQCNLSFENIIRDNTKALNLEEHGK